MKLDLYFRKKKVINVELKIIKQRKVNKSLTNYTPIIIFQTTAVKRNDKIKVVAI